jgi:hypothetical protein
MRALPEPGQDQTMVIDPSTINDALMKHNSAMGANTMEFPSYRYICKGCNNTVTIYSRWRP